MEGDSGTGAGEGGAAPPGAEVPAQGREQDPLAEEEEEGYVQLDRAVAIDIRGLGRQLEAGKLSEEETLDVLVELTAAASCHAIDRKPDFFVHRLIAPLLVLCNPATSAELLTLAVSLLNRLASCTDHRSAIVAEGAVPVLGKLLIAEVEEGVRQYTLRLFGRLTAKHEANQMVVHAQSLYPVLQRLMMADSVPLAQQANYVLWNLADTPAVAQYVAASQPKVVEQLLTLTANEGGGPANPAGRDPALVVTLIASGTLWKLVSRVESVRHAVSRKGLVRTMHELLIADHVLSPVVSPFTDIVLFVRVELEDEDAEAGESGLHSIVILFGGDIHYRRWS